MKISNYIISSLHSSPKLKHLIQKVIKSVNNIHKPVLSTDEDQIPNDIIKEYNSTRDFGFQKYLCHAPFSTLYFNTNGDVLACCKNREDVYGNVRDTSLIDIWNSNVKKQLQDKIKQNNLNSSCNFCKTQLERRNFSGVHARIHDYPFFKENYLYPKEITFEIANTCNLECIMCNGYFSSSIRKNREKLPPLINNYPLNFLEQLKPFLINLSIARFQGGEPFLINEYLDILEYINKYNPQCRIYIQTNGTIYNKRVERILSSPNIYLSISMDSLQKEGLEKIRKNINYEKFMENLNKFSIISSSHHHTLNINFCLMNNNWHEVPNLFDFCNKNKFSLTIIPTNFPPALSIEILTADEIDTICNHIINQTKKEDKEHFKIVYDSIIHMLDKLRDNI